MGISCFEGTFKLQVREGSCQYHAPPRRVASSLHEELARLQKQQIIVPLDVDETSEWCKSLMLVPKANGKVRLYFDLTWLKIVWIRPIYRCLTLNILPRLAGVKYLTLIDTSSGYHNLKLDEQSSYLTTFSCPFGRYSMTAFWVQWHGQRPWCYTWQGPVDMQEVQTTTQQRHMPVPVYKHTILWGDNIIVRGEPRSKKSTGTDGHAITKL